MIGVAHSIQMAARISVCTMQTFLKRWSHLRGTFHTLLHLAPHTWAPISVLLAAFLGLLSEFKAQYSLSRFGIEPKPSTPGPLGCIPDNISYKKASYCNRITNRTHKGMLLEYSHTIWSNTILTFSFSDNNIQRSFLIVVVVNSIVGKGTEQACELCCDSEISHAYERYARGSVRIYARLRSLAASPLLPHLLIVNLSCGPYFALIN